MIKIGRNDPCWCGSGKKYKHCHQAFDDRIMAEKAKGHVVPDHKLLKTPAQIEKIKESCKVNIAVLDFIAEHIREGITTEQIDKWVYEETTKRGAIPADLNCGGYPKSGCTSVNEQVCHGFPSDKVILKSGDFVNVDCSTILNGFFSRNPDQHFRFIFIYILTMQRSCWIHQAPRFPVVGTEPGTVRRRFVKHLRLLLWN